VPPHLVNQASGGINLMRQLGSAFGMSCVVAFMEGRIPFHAGAFAARQAEVGASGAELLERTRHLLAVAGVPEASQNAGALRYFGDMLHAQASTLGFQDAFAMLGLIGLLGLIPTLVLAATRDRTDVAG
jgi:MFS transporter, DHA2 family, multidrug resistance protein